jgi:hypothetical protein
MKSQLVRAYNDIYPVLISRPHGGRADFNLAAPQCAVYTHTVAPRRQLIEYAWRIRQAYSFDRDSLGYKPSVCPQTVAQTTTFIRYPTYMVGTIISIGILHIHMIEQVHYAKYNSCYH